MKLVPLYFFFVLILLVSKGHSQPGADNLRINDAGYFEKRGLNVFVFNSHYGLFGDEKLSGVEIIQHEVRTATNGDVRLNPTPEQWDSIPQFVRRNIDKKENSIEAFLRYPSFDFNYSVKVQPVNGGVTITVILEKELPAALIGRAGFNLEFLPSAYFTKTYIVDRNSGVFPLYPASTMTIADGVTEPKPLATGKNITLAPEDPERRVRIQSETDLQLFDGRNKAQNGWFVVRSLLPAGKKGKVLEWFLSANTIPGWTRKPVIAHSQLGYHPSQEKIAVIELDENDKPLAFARLMKVSEDGKITEQLKGNLKNKGKYLRYNYLTFDFSNVKDPGLYLLEYGNVRTKPFRISKDVYETAWHPTLDIYLPEQMDHMLVNEAYRVWHGASHLDDALQAPVNHEHFDLYAQGPTTDTRFKPYEHIPGLNVGGWYDAGDYDIRTQTQYAAVLDLVRTWELFKPQRDETLVDQSNRYIDLHHPDGKPDILQQVEHGTLQLLAQFNAVGHALNGIIEAHLNQYRHLGDAVTKTDNLVYNAALKEHQSDGFTSGNFDDRWAFTSKSSSLNYGSIAALSAASRVLKGYNDTLADQCIAMAKRVWEEEQTHAPDMFRHGNTTGGPLTDEKLKAALELLISTKEKRFADTLTAYIPAFEKQFGRYATLAVTAIPYMDASYKQKIEEMTRSYNKNVLEKMVSQNPFGVPITTGGWAGSGAVIGFGITNYFLWKAFPEIIDKEYVLRSLDYIYGTHPASDISLVSAVGTESKKIAYGNNRANFSFIAGGVVPGILIIPPDFPENKEDWPFLWGENEYVVNLGPSYILLINAANDLLNPKEK
ncbi:MAG: glycoside hydrolase family 9 protein [Flavisolibacter sp.]